MLLEFPRGVMTYVNNMTFSENTPFDDSDTLESSRLLYFRDGEKVFSLNLIGFTCLTSQKLKILSSLQLRVVTPRDCCIQTRLMA